MDLDRGPLLADETRTGSAWCKAYSDLIDEWLASVLGASSRATRRGVALVAVGGYGRAELCPGSDIDVMLVHTGGPTSKRSRIGCGIRSGTAGLHLGHSVQTAKQALELANDDLDTATSLLERPACRR